MIPRWRQVIHEIRAGRATTIEIGDAIGMSIRYVARVTRQLARRRLIVRVGQVLADGRGRPMGVWRARGRT